MFHVALYVAILIPGFNIPTIIALGLIAKGLALASFLYGHYTKDIVKAEQDKIDERKKVEAAEFEEFQKTKAELQQEKLRLRQEDQKAKAELQQEKQRLLQEELRLRQEELRLQQLRDINLVD